MLGRQGFVFTPDEEVDRLVFRLWPNGPRQRRAGASLEPIELWLNDQEMEVPEIAEDPTILSIPLPSPAKAGKAIKIDMAWRLKLPGVSRDRLSGGSGAIRLGSFFPILSWEKGRGWATEPPTSRLAEAGTSPVADFRLRVGHPSDLVVISSGEPIGKDLWEAKAVRDIALSLGRFRIESTVAHAPNPVRVTVGVDEDLDDDPHVYIDRIVRALKDLASRYGDYPYPTYSVAITPGLTGGIEYPGYAMQGPKSDGRSTPHEVAHQWFYSLVGNNQGRDPWLDEGLATWAEAQVEGTLDDFLRKEIPLVARGQMVQPMAWWDLHGESYYRGVYVQPVQAIASIAEPKEVDCALRRYVATNAHQIASPADLLEALQSILRPGASLPRLLNPPVP